MVSARGRSQWCLQVVRSQEHVRCCGTCNFKMTRGEEDRFSRETEVAVKSTEVNSGCPHS